jgi:hypothetical protein
MSCEACFENCVLERMFQRLGYERLSFKKHVLDTCWRKHGHIFIMLILIAQIWIYRTF